jgi:hypothetical protein
MHAALVFTPTILSVLFCIVLRSIIINKKTHAGEAEQHFSLR